MLTTGEERETEEEEEEEEEGEGSDGRALFPFLLRRLSCERKRTEDFPGGGEWATELKLSLSLSLRGSLPSSLQFAREGGKGERQSQSSSDGSRKKALSTST